MTTEIMQRKNKRFAEIRERKQGRGSPVRRTVLRCLAVIGTLLFSILIFLFGAITMICRGPSPTVRDLFVTTVMETSAAKFLAHMYFSDDEIRVIQLKNAVVDIQEVTDTSVEFIQSDSALPKDTIELLDVGGSTFKGKMLIVHDPSRIRVATAPVFGKDIDGVRMEDFVKNEKATAGINGGAFYDENGVGRGGMPLGVVIKDSKLVNGSLNTADSVVIGFDQSNKLIVGKMSGQEALDLKLRDAVSFGPVFIVNGKPVDVAGTGGGLNPRTVIGQRADGAVLMLVIDGRQAHSIGASYKDCIDVMMQYGAINAANLDGGSSSMMIYNGEVVNVSASLYGSRKLPTAFIVK